MNKPIACPFCGLSPNYDTTTQLVSCGNGLCFICDKDIPAKRWNSPAWLKVIKIYRRALYLAEVAPEGDERTTEELITAIQHDINCAKEYPNDNPEIWSKIEE